jgi:hypothetical protein
METNTNIAANAEPGVQTEDFAERVRVNQGKLASELRPHYDFVVCGSGSSDAKHQVSSDAAPRGCAAALVKFNASATAKKYRRCSSSTAQFYHAEKAWRHIKHDIGRLKTRRRLVM